jgi:hypothetical protein
VLFGQKWGSRGTFFAINGQKSMKLYEISEKCSIFEKNYDKKYRDQKCPKTAIFAIAPQGSLGSKNDHKK